MPESVKDVVAERLCTQCGTCVAVCPVHAIEMRETPAGMLTAAVREEACIRCGKCLLACPGAGIDLGLPAGIDPFRGEVQGVYVAYARDDAIRSSGQSGGLLSALLLFLLDTERIDAAMVVSMPKDGSFRPRTILARTRQEILAAQGSKYCPTGANAALGAGAARDRVAVVGTACQMHGIYKAAQHRFDLAGSVEYRIGLFCDRTLLYTCIDQMRKDAGLGTTKVAGLEYRSKARKGWPGEVCFHLDSGQEKFYPSSLRTRLKDAFTVPRCRLCFDKLNVLSDVSAGDAYGVSESVQGHSVVIARNRKGLSLVREASAAGYVVLEETDPEPLFKGQGVEIRRRRFTTFMTLWREMGRPAPEYRGLDPRFLAEVDPAAKAGCRQKLLLNCRVADEQTRSAALATAHRAEFATRIRSLVDRAMRKLFGKRASRRRRRL
jgi:coenzyme F420 hydrogenase subunit beta